jgi:hypothetical protein
VTIVVAGDADGVEVVSVEQRDDACGCLHDGLDVAEGDAVDDAIAGNVARPRHALDLVLRLEGVHDDLEHAGARLADPAAPCPHLRQAPQRADLVVELLVGGRPPKAHDLGLVPDNQIVVGRSNWWGWPLLSWKGLPFMTILFHLDRSGEVKVRWWKAGWSFMVV